MSGNDGRLQAQISDVRTDDTKVSGTIRSLSSLFWPGKHENALLSELDP